MLIHYCYFFPIQKCLHRSWWHVSLLRPSGRFAVDRPYNYCLSGSSMPVGSVLPFLVLFYFIWHPPGLLKRLHVLCCQTLYLISTFLMTSFDTGPGKDRVGESLPFWRQRPIVFCASYSASVDSEFSGHPGRLGKVGRLRYCLPQGLVSLSTLWHHSDEEGSGSSGSSVSMEGSRCCRARVKTP